MLVSWPGKVAPASTCDDYLIIEDFYPTILELAGITNYQTVQKTDRPLFWHFPNEWGPTGPGIGAASTIRKGDWKLIYYHTDESFELFNVKEDISEDKNRIKEDKEKAKELAKELTEYLKAVNAQMPKHLNSDKQVSWPDEKFIS